MRLLGLIGYPLSHSYSQQYFATRFESEGIRDAHYELFEMKSLSGFPGWLKEHGDLSGFNVTIPHKGNIIRYLDELDPVARELGAVNCVKVVRHGSGISLHGFNTDVDGFRQSLLPVLKPWHRKALILGTGGGARAVAHVLRRLGVEILFVSRDPGDGNRFSYGDITGGIMESHPLIVNTTPLGMYPDIDSFPPLPYQFISTKHLFFDLVYNPAATRFMEFGEKAGATVKNGLEMLYIQADRSWDIWDL